MKKNAIDICAVSNLFETAPQGVFESQPNYYNAVTRIQTCLSPDELHNATTHIEHTLGRRDKGLRKPRTIDLDILIYGNERYCSENLTIPHPRMLDRQFVLAPLSEVITSGWPQNLPDIQTLCQQFTDPMNPIRESLSL